MTQSVTWLYRVVSLAIGSVMIACSLSTEPTSKIEGAFGIKFGQEIAPKDIVERSGSHIRLHRRMLGLRFA
jgi:hypothetical protein